MAANRFCLLECECFFTVDNFHIDPKKKKNQNTKLDHKAYFPAFKAVIGRPSKSTVILKGGNKQK